MHLFAIVANNAYLCLVLADEICYGISSLGLEAKDCVTAKGLHILLWIKKALTIRFVFWHLETSTLSWLFQTHCSSGRPIYGMNTCHTLIVSWRQALCPVVRMLDRVYYIILCGASHCSFLNSQAVEGLKMWNGRNSASSTLFISAIQAKTLGMNKSRLP